MFVAQNNKIIFRYSYRYYSAILQGGPKK